MQIHLKDELLSALQSQQLSWYKTFWTLVWPLGYIYLHHMNIWLYSYLYQNYYPISNSEILYLAQINPKIFRQGKKEQSQYEMNPCPVNFLKRHWTSIWHAHTHTHIYIYMHFMLSKRHNFADFTSVLYKYLKGIDSIDIHVLGLMYNLEILLCPKWVDEC